MVGFVDSNLAGHLLDDLIEEWIGVDEEKVGLLASEEGDEVAGISQAYECLVRVDDGLTVADAISEDLEMVLGHAPTLVGVRAEELLYHSRVDCHGCVWGSVFGLFSRV